MRVNEQFLNMFALFLEILAYGILLLYALLQLTGR